nr:MAG TPA: hypothetical protein [Caudoviricetes sp.]
MPMAVFFREAEGSPTGSFREREERLSIPPCGDCNPEKGLSAENRLFERGRKRSA